MQQQQSRAQLLPGERRAFLLGKLHSFTGLVPAGLFVVLHLFTNVQALRGQAAFDAALDRSVRLPMLFVFELVGLWVPLLFHGLYGLYRTLRCRPNLRAYPFSRHWAYVTQRLTGVLVLLFLGWHLWQLRLAVLRGQMNRSDYFVELCSRLAATGALGAPWIALAFLTAMAAIAFHWANGVHGFCFSWGVTRSRPASRRASAVCGLAGIALFVVGASTILYFATGWRVGSSDTFADVPVGTGCQELSDGQRAAIERTTRDAPAAASARPSRR